MKDKHAQEMVRRRWGKRLTRDETMEHLGRLLDGGWSYRLIGKALGLSQVAVYNWSTINGFCAPATLAKLPTDQDEYDWNENVETEAKQ